MNDLISRSALLDSVEKCGILLSGTLYPTDEEIGAHKVFCEIVTAPAVDAVEVVRCGECEKRNKSADLTDSIYCRWLKCQMRKNDFCSYGERRTE